jgi:hypothetical protein
MQHIHQATTADVPYESSADEVGELVSTLFATPAHRLTACRGWTAHELVAHLAAGAAEEADLIESHLTRAPERPTRTHEAREQPYRALPDPELRDRLVEHAGRLTALIDELHTADPTGAVPFTGRAMTAADFVMHSRSECALHRWDLVGRDDVGWAMLGNPALTVHAVDVLMSMSTLPEAPANRLGARAEPGTARLVLRSAPHDDVVITVTDGTLGMTLEPISDTAPAAELEAATRLLALWGRREPSAPVDVCADGEHRGMLETLFGW